MREYAQDIAEAGLSLAEATLREMAIEDTRPLVKAEAIRRLVGTENPANGKLHSASSAEAVVEMDAEYAATLKAKREAVFQKIVARANYDASVAAARLATMEVAV